jgi:hypothetical protein
MEATMGLEDPSDKNYENVGIFIWHSAFNLNHFIINVFAYFYLKMGSCLANF